MSDQPRVALLAPYWTFWEPSAGGPGFRQEREALLEQAAEGLAAAAEESGGLRIAWRGLVDSAESGERAAAEMSRAGAEVILTMQTMAVPPMYAKTALDGMAEAPVIVWAAQRSRSVWVGFDQYDITTQGATVGTPMLTNVLGREGRPFELVVGAVQDAEVFRRLVRVIRAAATAAAVSRARIARVGRPVDGYACVDADDGELRRAIGLEVVAVSPDEIADRYRRCSDFSRLEEEIGERFEDAAPDEPARARSLRLAAVLEDLDREGGFHAGAMNCHVPQIRYGEDPGVTPCFALGRETTRGVPWTCTGDVVTAVAMLAAKRLGGAALYHEVEAIDFVRGETAIANSGEHDLSWCPEEVRPRLQPNPWFLSDPLTGVSAWFELPPGPATLIGFTPHHAEPSGFRLIAAEGEITERSFPDSPTAGGAFRFAGDDPVGEVWRRWALAGVNHHSACAPGRLADQVATVANYLKIGFIQVS